MSNKPTNYDLIQDIAIAEGGGGHDLSNVTNDAQLKRARNDFVAFAEKSVPVGADKLLIEDSEGGDPILADWTCCACSSDGHIQIAGIYGGRLYVSIDSGATWVERKPAGSVDKHWRTCACNSAGNIMIAGEKLGRLYVSNDSGSTWTETKPNGNIDGEWSVASNLDGSVLVAACRFYGLVFISQDFGVSWISSGPTSEENWQCCACNSDGQILMVGSDNGRLWISTDLGSAWSEVRPGGDFPMDWTSVACDSNGSVMMATNHGNIYLSTNSGVNWTIPIFVEHAFGCKSNSDGSVLLLISDSSDHGGAFVSTDFGVTWSTKFLGTTLHSCACNPDGNVLMAGSATAQLLVSVNSGSAWVASGPIFVGGKKYITLGSLLSPQQSEIQSLSDALDAAFIRIAALEALT